MTPGALGWTTADGTDSARQIDDHATSAGEPEYFLLFSGKGARKNQAQMKSSTATNRAAR
jgi:hypothetical protein